MLLHGSVFGKAEVGFGSNFFVAVVSRNTLWTATRIVAVARQQPRDTTLAFLAGEIIPRFLVTAGFVFTPGNGLLERIVVVAIEGIVVVVEWVVGIGIGAKRVAVVIPVLVERIVVVVVVEWIAARIIRVHKQR